MKRVLIWGVLIIFLSACAGEKNMVKIEPAEEENNPADSTEYELITFDSKFETWYDMNNSPANYRTQQFYESWNRRYVSAWDINAMDPSKHSFFEPIVGYEPGVDYGFELNHKLFYYFQYVEHVLKIPILASPGPRVVLMY